MKYVDIQKYWRKIKPIAIELKHIWYQDMLEYRALQQAQCLESCGKLYWHAKFNVPADLNSCDWQYNHRGRKPKYWDYVCPGACHWLVNFNMCVALIALPEYDWRIVTSEKHSTVWNGKNLLYDPNFLALEVSAKEAWKLANEEILEPGQPIMLYPWVDVIKKYKKGKLARKQILRHLRRSGN